MPPLPAWLDRYRTLPKNAFLFAAGQFLINLINSAQFLLLNLFLKGHGLDDPAIASLSSKRFVATFLLALPAGLWLRGRPLRWPLMLSAALFPALALGGIEAARTGRMGWASAAFLAMGFAGLVLNVASLPMILRLVPSEKSSEALSLLFSTWAAAAICAGALSSGLQWLGHLDLGFVRFVLDEHATLFVLTVAGLGAPFLYATLPDPVPDARHQGHWLAVRSDDWPVLVKALLPSLCIATGAGLSIQFLNLFFSHVHKLGAASYSAFATVSHVLVFFAGLLVPEVRRRFGWRGAIAGVQGLAVGLLVMLGLTELWAHLPWALPLAVVLFVLRQPLMSMAGPATSDLTMRYVGKRNHELVSACNGAIWSGAWWLAAVIFEKLRAQHMPYWEVFLTTATLYLFGIVAYLFLIRQNEKQEARAGGEPVDDPNLGEAGFPQSEG